MFFLILEGMIQLLRGWISIYITFQNNEMTEGNIKTYKSAEDDKK